MAAPTVCSQCGQPFQGKPLFRGKLRLCSWTCWNKSTAKVKPKEKDDG